MDSSPGCGNSGFLGFVLVRRVLALGLKLVLEHAQILLNVRPVF